MTKPENQPSKETRENMDAYSRVSALVKNNLLELSDKLFELGQEYKPTGLTKERLNSEPLSLIIGEHPSEYALSPQMWDAEFKLRGEPGLFLPADIPVAERTNLPKLLDEALALGSEHFRVLTITNPFKIDALLHLKEAQKSGKYKIDISADAERIGATNQILIGPDNVFHVINSDGRGMANAVENFLRSAERGSLAGKNVGIIGAGGAARGIIYEITRRTGEKPGGEITIFNRTVQKAADLAEEFRKYFPETKISVRPLSELKDHAKEQEVLVSSVTEGDPLLENGAHESLPAEQLIVDANYGAKSVLAGSAAAAGRKDLNIHDGRGMVVEGYIIPSRELSSLWGYEVPEEVYTKIGKMFNYQP